jgi:hypothetical protein
MQTATDAPLATAAAATPAAVGDDAALAPHNQATQTPATQNPATQTLSPSAPQPLTFEVQTVVNAKRGAEVVARLQKSEAGIHAVVKQPEGNLVLTLDDNRLAAIATLAAVETASPGFLHEVVGRLGGEELTTLAGLVGEIGMEVEMSRAEDPDESSRGA